MLHHRATRREKRGVGRFESNDDKHTRTRGGGSRLALLSARKLDLK